MLQVGMLPYTPDWDHVSTANGYKVVRCVGHPKAWKKGSYVYVHVVVAEWKLGRLLQDTEVVHHDDENKFNNSPDNIVVTPSDSVHASIHAQKRSKAVSVELRCAACGKPIRRPRSRTPEPLGYTRAFCDSRCAGKVTGFKPVTEIPHGTANAYNYHKCRCDLCRAAKRDKKRKERSSKGAVL